jgi:hypothetical protein
VVYHHRGACLIADVPLRPWCFPWMITLSEKHVWIRRVEADLRDDRARELDPSLRRLAAQWLNAGAELTRRIASSG